MSFYTFLSSFFVVLNLLILVSDRVNAQIKPDSTLGSNSSVISPNQIVNGVSSNVILGGAIRGSNLFHSFQDFNVNSGQGAYFANPNGITNILTRVTGKNPSNIFGVLGVIGSANLFFLNPNGIIFGPHASLNLNGSFLATTASNINMSDGTVFSATNPQSVPLLTINVPIGLNFTGENPASIQVQRVGHTLSASSSIAASSIVGAGLSTTGLRVQAGKNIALVGGETFFDGGIVTAPGGRIEIGSVNTGKVTINLFPKEQWLDYSSVQKFNNIGLTNLSLLDASGGGNGNISIYGNQITMSNGSYALIEPQRVTPPGRIMVNAAEALRIIGSTSNLSSEITPSTVKTRSAILTQGFSDQGANIFVSTKKLDLQSAGVILSVAVPSGSTGNISINASDSIQVVGFSLLDPINSYSSIATSSGGNARAGNILLRTDNLLVANGGNIGSGTYGVGSGGNVFINAAKSILLKGTNSFSLVPSILVSDTFGGGNAGDLIVNTPELTLLEGGRVDSSTLASGKAGSVTINAPNYINLSGTVPKSINPSLIISSGNLVDPILKQILGLSSSLPSGASGNVTINTGTLSVTNGAQVTVRNDGTGNAGTLQINARSIFLDKQGGITASTANGSGGNIFLHLANQLNLDHNSLITATAGGQGTGGNITIDSRQTTISNGSGTAVSSTGTGNAGQLKISSNNLTLNNGGMALT